MSHSFISRRGRGLAALTSVAGLALTTATIVGSPAAQSAPPAEDCKAAFPVADLVKGDAVTALSVTSGTAPDTFTGTVLGVLDDGIAPDLDMVMVEMDAPSPDKIGGIWQGMSGSPVYAADGRLIGAVAYGLSWGPSWVAGVTPFEDMDEYLNASRPASIKVTDAQARTIARHSDVTQAQAAQGFSQLKMPLGVSGVGSTRLAKAERKAGAHSWIPKNTYATGKAAAPGAGAGAESVVAGGNLAASLSYGDITQGGVGTATSVCGGKVVGFGHPMTFLGETTLSLHPADAIYIQPESLGAPFKVANLGAPVGTITDDHLTGITGSFGALPDTTDITSSVTFGTRSRTGTSHVSVSEANASTTFYQLISNNDRVLDSYTKGSGLLSWTINGHQDDGTPFSFSVSDRYASDYDISFESSFDLADFVWSLSNIPGVNIDDVSATSELNKDNSVYRVNKIQQKVGGEWVTLDRKHPAVGKAGSQLNLRAVLDSATGNKTVPLSVSVPDSAAGSRGRLEVLGGLYTWSRNQYPSTLGQAQKYIDTYVRNDQVQVSLDLFSRKADKGISKVNTTDAQDKVVAGRKAVRVKIL